ncbi:MAG: pilus assembly protein PilM [Nitrospirae bacterium]|nr:pilus assembly protein PilM [Nitrospirota bacterium]
MKITCLDIGRHSIKILGVKKSAFGIEFTDQEVLRIPRSSTIPKEETLKGILKEVIKRKKIRERELAVSLQSNFVTTRFISLPFKDKGKISRVAPFELEGQVPFETEDLITDYHIISRDQAGSNLLVAAVEKRRLKDLLGMLREAGVEPGLVGADHISLFNISRFLLNETGDYAIIDMGASKTSICLISNGIPKGVRTILLGGDLITDVIRDRLSVSPDEAERIKHEMKEDEKIGGRISEIIRPPVQALLGEIEKTLHIMEGGDIGKITSLYLCGGGARLKGIRELVSDRIGIGSVEILGLTTGSGLPGSKKRLKHKPERDGIDEVFFPAIGLALGYVSGEKGCNINFKQGEFAGAKEKRETRSRLIYLGSVILLILMVALADIYIKYQIKDERYQKVKSEVRAVFKDTLPEIKNIVDETSQLKGAKEDLRKKAEILIRSEVTMLEILNLLSEEIPKEITIDIYELSIDQDKVRIDAETDSFESIDRIKGGLKRGPLFKEVNVSDAKVGANQKKVRFRITIAMSEKV